MPPMDNENIHYFKLPQRMRFDSGEETKNATEEVETIPTEIKKTMMHASKPQKHHKGGFGSSAKMYMNK